MSLVAERVWRWRRWLDGLRARLWEIAVPRSVGGKAGVVVAGLIWIPGFTLLSLVLVTFADALLWQGAALPAALRAAYFHGWALMVFPAEEVVPGLVLVSTGGFGLALGWAAVARTGRWVVASVGAALATPFVAVTCWVLAVDPGVPWWWTLQRCLGPGFVWSIPLWGICFWAHRRKGRDRWGWWPVAAWLGLAGAGCVIGIGAVVNLTSGAGGFPPVIGS